MEVLDEVINILFEEESCIHETIAIMFLSIYSNLPSDISFKIYDAQHIYNSKCPICLEELTNSDEIPDLACKHGFHKKCLFQWIRRHNINCPICKSKIQSKIQS